MNFRPTKKRIIIFIILAIIILLILSLTQLKIFPCKTRSTLQEISGPQEFKSTLCSIDYFLAWFFIKGVEAQMSWVSYLLLLVILIVIPYLITCLIIKN